MLFKRGAAVVLLAMVVGACSQTPPETRLIQQAAQALGGAERVQAVATLVIEGEGIAPNIGQNSTPDGPLENWRVTEFRRSIDLANGRMHTEALRTPDFVTTLANQRVNQGLDGDVAFNVGGPQSAASRISALATRERRLEMLHHPLTLVRAALDPTSQVSNFRDQGLLQLVDITTAAGDTITVAFDRGSNLPTNVTSTSYHPNLGDVVIQTTFGDYAAAGGLNLPRRLTTRLDQYTQLDLTVANNTVDADVGDLAAPAEVVAAAEPPMLPEYEITPQQVARGIWLLPGSHNSIVFEFADHLKMVEAPLNESRTLAAIAAARALRPEKPLTHVIMTHHHFDHSGGLRAAVAEGLTIVAHRGNEGFIDAMVERPHTIVQDALARNPQPAKIDAVEDEAMLMDDQMEVRLYHVKNEQHSQAMLMIFVPRDGLLIQGDLYTPTASVHPRWDTLQQNITERGIKVERHLPIHGSLQTAKEAADTVAKAAAAAPTP